jgi:hypothetical protein
LRLHNGCIIGCHWERHLELGGSALKSAAWATRLTAVINVPRGHGLQAVYLKASPWSFGDVFMYPEGRSRPDTWFLVSGVALLPNKGQGGTLWAEKLAALARKSPPGLIIGPNRLIADRDGKPTRAEYSEHATVYCHFHLHRTGAGAWTCTYHLYTLYIV